MGLGDLLKRALGAVGEFDRKGVYGPDYKARSESLAQLNDLTIRAKLLENQDKFERIQGMRQELADRERTQKAGAFKDAMVLGSQVPPTDSGIAGPPNDANPADLAGKNLPFEPPSFLKERLNEADNPVLQKAIQEGWRLKQKKEAQADQTFEADLGYKNYRDDVEQARIRNLNSATDKNNRYVPGGAHGGADWVMPNGGIGASGGVFGIPAFNKRTGQMTFVSPDNAPGYVPSSARLTQGTKEGLTGIGTSYDNLTQVEQAVSKATSILGPAAGRIALGESRWLGGEGLSADQVNALVTLDRATMMAAFQNGGKQLTGIELETFLRQYPQASDNLQTLLTKSKLLKKLLKQEARKRKDTMTDAEKIAVPEVFKWGVFGPDEEQDATPDASIPPDMEVVNGVLRMKGAR